MSKLLSLASFVAAIFVATLVHAKSPKQRGARLTWVRGIEADRCVGSLGLEEDVKTRLGYDSFKLPPELTIEGTIVRAGTGHRAEIVVRDASGKVLGTRQLASREADCRALGEAVAVAITVAIDPEAIGAPQPQVEEVPPAEPPPAPAITPPPPRSDRGHALLMGGASVGLLPEIAPSASLRVRGLIGSALEVGIGAHVWPESRTSGFGFALTSGALEACVKPFASARVLAWCAAGHFGLFHVFVHDPNLAPVDVGMFPWFGADTGPAISIPLGSFLRIEANVAAVVPILRREAFVRGNPTPVWEQSLVGGRAEVGVGASF